MYIKINTILCLVSTFVNVINRKFIFNQVTEEMDYKFLNIKDQLIIKFRKNKVGNIITLYMFKISNI